MAANNCTNYNIGCLNIRGTHMTAYNSNNNNIGCLNIRRNPCRLRITVLIII